MYLHRSIGFLSILFAVTILATLYIFDPLKYAIYPACMVKKMTGLDCPGCGAARSMHALLHGDIASAANYNLLLILLLPVIVLGMFKWWNKKDFAWKRLDHPRFILIIICIFWLLRNIKVEPFTYLNSTP